MASRNYLITGASRGIGRGLSRLLLGAGHRVFLTDIDQDELHYWCNRLSATHQRGQHFESSTCDLRKIDELRRITEQASTFFSGHLDVLINNAANTTAVGQANAATITLEQWNASVETNLTAPLFLSQFSIPLLQKTDSRELGGSIIHISSTRAVMSEPDNEGYSATKAGLLGLTNSMSVSLAPQGIRVNAILPGWINVTNENKQADEKGQSWSDGLSKDDQSWHLSGRVGKVEDIFEAVEYLSGSGFMSGAEIVIDGGVTRKMVYPE